VPPISFAHLALEQGSALTLQAEMTPSPPAHTMVFFTLKLHQSHLEHVSWSTTGCRPCCSSSAMGPSAGEREWAVIEEPEAGDRTRVMDELCCCLWEPCLCLSSEGQRGEKGGDRASPGHLHS
jgi:hypothetical protein